MGTRTTKWPAGTPCWADLATPDLGTAQRFYGALLGWEFDDQGLEFGNYSFASHGGTTAAGIGPAQEGAPHVWTLYLASDDADATASSITEHGGAVLAEPFDAPDGTPSHWLAYFGVADADAAVETATANGRTVLAPAFETPYGKMAALMDPAGAVFWVAQTDGSSQPDRSG